MKKRSVNVFRPIKVIQNTHKRGKSPTRMTIKDADSGQVLHVGEPTYIKRVAAKRYNVVVV
jgi:hypothetical protein